MVTHDRGASYKKQPMLSRFFTTTMSKHPRSPSLNTTSFKRSRTTHSTFSPNKVASPSAAASVDTNPPLHTLLQVVYKGAKVPAKGDCVVYWMRMADLRSTSNLFTTPVQFIKYLAGVVSDNRALFMASQQAKKDAIPLIVLFVISPQDYIAHDRSARRIDFTLRSLAIIKVSVTYSESVCSSHFIHRHPCAICIFLSTP